MTMSGNINLFVPGSIAWATFNIASENLGLCGCILTKIMYAHVFPRKLIKPGYIIAMQGLF